MPESFTTLLQKSWTYFAGHIKPILIAAVVFGIILHFAQASLAHKTMGSMEDRLGSLDTVKMEELSERIENGDEQAFQEMMMELGVLGESGEIYEEKMQGMAVEFMTKLLPSIGVFTIVMMVLSLISFTYFSILAVDDTQSALHIFRRTPGLILPIIGISLWSFLRSFSWIPFIGFIPGIIIGPRLIFAGVIFIKEQKGVIESVKLSYDRTSGYWGKIVGNMILMMLCLCVAGLLLMIAVGIVGMIVPMFVGVITGALSYLYTAFAAIFTTQLALTVMAYPMRPQKVL